MKKAYACVFAAALLFATMEVACKIGGNNLDPFQLTFIRFAIGGLMLLPFALKDIRKNETKLTAEDFVILAGIGTLGIAVSMVLFQISVNTSNASTVSVIFSMNPFFTMTFAHIFTSEKMNIYKAAALAIALAGIVFMFRPWDIQEGNTALGMTLMVLAALVFGLYTVLSKYSIRKMGLMAQTSISFLLGSFVLMVIIILMGRPVLDGVTESIPIIIYTGILVTGMGYFFYFKAIELADATTGSYVFFLKPAMAPVFAVIVLNETLLWNTYVGIILVLAASLLNLIYQKKAIKKL